MPLSKIQTTNNQVVPNLGRRNIVINGAMQVAQRGTSVANVGSTTSGFHTVDRFKHFSDGSSAGRLTMSQVSVTDLAGFANALKLDCTTADTSIATGEYFMLSHPFEGQDLQQFKKGTSSAEKFTLSFYVKGNASATYSVELNDNNNSRRIGQTFSVTTSWNRVILTYDGDTSGVLPDTNVVSLYINFWLHAGSTFTGGTHGTSWAANVNNQRAGNSTSIFDSTDRTLEITGVQLEVGSVATPFEYKSFGEELNHCERYFYTTYPYGATIGAASSVSYLGRFLDGTQSYGSLQVPNVNMRVSPSRVIYNTATGTAGQIRTDTQNVAAAITGTGQKGGGWIYVNAVSVGTSTSTKAHLTMDAEM